MQAKAISDTKEAKPSVRLFNRNFILLWQGQTVSQLGNQAFYIALALWIKSATGSATLMGLMLMVSSLPAVLLGPIGGVVADRYPRRRIIIFSDLCGGLVVLFLAGTMVAAPTATSTIIAVLFVVSIVLAVITAFFNPAITAAIPDIVPEEKLPGANGLFQFSYQLAIFIGQGIGGTLFRILGAPILFFIDGITFLFSSLSESLIVIPQQIPDKSKDWRSGVRQFKEDTIVGFHSIFPGTSFKTVSLRPLPSVFGTPGSNSCQIHLCPLRGLWPKQPC